MFEKDFSNFKIATVIKIFIYLIISLILASCYCDNDTYYLNEDNVKLLPYNSTNSTSFIDENQNIITFNDVFYERDIYENGGFNNITGSRCKDSFENVRVSIRSNSGYDIYIDLESDRIESNRFTATIVDYNVPNFGGYYSTKLREELSNYTLNGVTFGAVTRLYNQNNNNEIFLVPNIGIIHMRFANTEFTLN
ncbi:hypothetical protein LX97_01609 [Nonlabens dokdonensis]|jgi:hypothetical protein|uniref:Lipoprotein n=2 Tax=Nonlabens dokdonensis TaxID=328515 RepID=L7WB46_NONDD|nr:hypothetical protein [Nonlabens dokdonensis]AGC77304.1 hypothetical protein DDD_2177 [Nonlabens dokdonensis DSW-6]PZX40836.1 hypothetical protein LX97_01609 [Nonlabens dokdonensis]